MFRRIFNPMLFQGKMKKRKYFEGWYYKLVSKDQLHTVALIPGISLNPVDSHAFIQVFHTQVLGSEREIQTDYVRFPLDDFQFDFQKEQLNISSNHFLRNEVDIFLKSENLNVKGKISLHGLQEIKKNLLSPSIMGIFGYLQFMECYHGIVSMTHELTGTLTINNQSIDFSGGKGYIEKDWGKSFPSKYVWMQSNHFEDPTASFMFSHASIPFLGLRFKGLIAVLIANQKEYRFATYNGSRILKYGIGSDHCKYWIKKGRYLLEVEAFSQETAHLPSPKNGMMNQSIKEGLSGKIIVRLYKNNKVVFMGQGENSGLEIMM